MNRDRTPGSVLHIGVPWDEHSQQLPCVRGMLRVYLIGVDNEITESRSVLIGSSRWARGTRESNREIRRGQNHCWEPGVSHSDLRAHRARNFATIAPGTRPRHRNIRTTRYAPKRPLKRARRSSKGAAPNAAGSSAGGGAPTATRCMLSRTSRSKKRHNWSSE